MSDIVGVQRLGPTRPSVPLSEITLLVRVPGQPAAVRSFTDADRAQAQAYAEATGGVVETLPLDPPGAAVGARAS